MAITPQASVPSTQALALMGRIEERFQRPDGDYGERWFPTSGVQDVAYAWTVGVWLEAMLEASRRSEPWRKKTMAYLDRVDRYWSTIGPTPGFAVLPLGKERYYDDNAWLVLALANAAEVTGDARWRDRARESLTYVLSGEDDKLGGGIYWKEAERASKNTCSNAPAIVGCLVLAKTKNDPLLDRAKKLYDWTRRTLRDPNDGLYWDNIRLDGTIEKTKWSYNSGLMLRAATELYAATRGKKYQRDAQEITRNGWKHWARPKSGEFKCEGRFAHLFLDAYWAAANPAQRKDAKALIESLANRADDQGFFGKKWYETSTPPSSYELIDQASMARALWIAARD